MRTSILSLVALLGCTTTPESKPLSLPQALAAAVRPLTLTSSGDLVIGERVTFTVTGAPANKPVVIVGSLAASGTPYCPIQLAPTCTDLFGSAQLLGQATADGSGTATLSVNVPTTVPVGRVARLQALAVTRNDQFKSGVLAQPFVTAPTPTATTVPAIRTGSGGHVVGDLLQVANLAVSAVGPLGFTAQAPGAQNVGIYVFTNGEVTGISQGDVVTVTGRYEEYSGSGGTAPLATLTELVVLASVAGSEVVVTGSRVPATASVTVATLSSAATAEPYEGMIVSLAPATGLEVQGVDAFDEFTVSEPPGSATVGIDNEFFSLRTALPDLDVGSTFDTITGVLFFSFGAHKVGPTRLADATGFVAAPGDTGDTGDTGTTPLPANLLLTEVCDYGPDIGMRFVEIYNASGAPVNLSPYAIRRYSNGGTTAFNIPLSGTVAAGATWVVGNTELEDWVGAFGAVPNAFDADINANGDDAYALGFNDGSGYVNLDVYGEIGVDGTGTAWEFLDQIATRACTVTAGTTSFAIGEWSIGDESTESLGSFGPCP